MRMARVVPIAVLIVIVASWGAYGQCGSGTTGPCGDPVMSYVPGTTISYTWVAPCQGLEQMQMTKRPGLFYFYNPRDPKSAYEFELKLFDKCKKPGEDCVTMKWDSTVKLPTKELYMPKGKTGVVLMDYTGRKIASIPRPVSAAVFKKTVDKVVEKNKKKVESAAKSATEPDSGSCSTCN